MIEEAKESINQNLQKLDSLRNGVCQVSFVKKDGASRVMSCTLNTSLIPKEHQNFKNGTNKPNVLDTHLRVFDVEREGWRTLIYDNITDFVE